ncbi:MAG: aspartate carbamoyltransferase catalytic subunit [Dehalococcoidia bacterium]
MAVSKVAEERPAVRDAPAPEPRRRHVLDLNDFSADEIQRTLETADAMAEVLGRPIRKVPTLRGRTIVTLFYEPSTRTRASFEQAGKIMSADVINLSSSDSSGRKGESLVDTARTLEAMGTNVLILRHGMSGAPYLVARHTSLSVINAGDGWHAHPSQALLDLYTIKQRCGRIQGLKVVIVGDILHSRVARSNVWGLRTMGADVTLCGPPTLLPTEALEAFGDSDGGLSVETDLDAAIEGADVVMALRMQTERQEAGLTPSVREYIRSYQVNEERMARAKATALVMHPGPMNEGVEISHGLAHGARSLVESQVTNGVAVRMGLLYLLASPGVES